MSYKNEEVGSCDKSVLDMLSAIFVSYFERKFLLIY